jgi:uncharacterized membrane protein
MKSKSLFTTIIVGSIMFNSCKKEEEVVVIPKTTFVEVNTILAASCAPCHVANSGANFEARKKHVNNYEVSKGLATFILDRVKRDPSAAGFMPRGGTKLSEANIAIIQKWIDDGL